jgi:hypothetical protein
VGPRDALFGVLVPALISAALLLIAWRPWRRGGTGPNGSWTTLVLGALAMSVGPIAADLLIRGRQGLWPVATTFFVPHATIVAATAGMAMHATRGRTFVRALVVFAAALLVACLLTQHRVQNQWTTGQSLGWLAGLSIVPGVLALATEAHAMRTGGARLPLLAWLAFSAGSVVLLFSHAAALGQIAGSFAAAVGPFVLLAWWRRDRCVMQGASVIVALMLPGLLTVHFYAQIPIASAVLVAAIPLVAWTASLGPMRKLPAWLATLVCVIVGSAMAGAAIAIAAPPADENPLLLGRHGPAPAPSRASE